MPHPARSLDDRDPSAAAMSAGAAFVRQLRALPALPGTFNPWRDTDPQNDISERSPLLRAEHLRRYLDERVGRARVLLIAEALGYQGGHFSGIAMTSERILLGNLAHKGIAATDVIEGGGLARTSLSSTMSDLGANEPTATIVWGAIKAAGIDPRTVVLWNAFALHPMGSPTGWLTNRKPTDAELRAGRPLLEHFLDLFKDARTIAVGKVSEQLLGNLGIEVAGQVRHPANGGATQFREGVARLLQQPGA